MEGVKLAEQEQTFYGELFQNCDIEGSGKVTGSKASDLFRLSGLSQDVLLQISELCGAKRLGHFGRSQFYIALKLIAAVQCGLPAKLDSLNSGMEITLPKFHRANGHDKWKSQQSPTGCSAVITGDSEAAPISDNVCPVTNNSNATPTICRTAAPPALSQPTGQLPPPPATKKSHTRNLSGQYRSLQSDNPPQYSQQSRDESPHDSKSPPFSPKQSPPTSPNRMKLGNIGKQQTAPASVNTSLISNSSNDRTATNINAAASVGQVTPVVPAGYPTLPSQPTASATTTPGGSAAGAIVTGVSVVPGSGVAGPVPGLIQPPVPLSASTYSNSVHDVAGWASFEDEESKGLLDTAATKSSWENLESQCVDSSSISSEAESVDDVWTISKEQREYYVKQFKTMQSELNGVILGSIAKEFFEKSKLPVHELSKIWQLSDLNRDGALSLDEFCIAMHLVVLRRNEIELPDHLPVSLMPYSTLTNGKNEPFAADLPPGSTLKRSSPTSPPSSQWTRTSFPVESPTSSGLSSPTPKPVNFEFSKPVATDPDSKIVHPVALRMSPDGHPIPPEIIDRNNWTAAATAADLSAGYCNTVQQVVCGDQHDASSVAVSPTSKPPQRMSYGVEPSSLNDLSAAIPTDHSSPMSPKLALPSINASLHGRPRPVPTKKTAPVAGPGHLQPPPAPVTGSGDVITNSSGPEKGPAGTMATVNTTAAQTTVQPTTTLETPVSPGTQIGPPRLPPRPNHQSHGRSVSVDLKLKSDVGASVLLPPPAVPPRISPKDGLPPIVSHGDTDVVESSVSSTAKVLPEDTKSEEDETNNDRQKSMYYGRQPSRDKREMQLAINTHKERNGMLERVNSELNQELQEVMEQRIALEIQLEHLRPYHS